MSTASNIMKSILENTPLEWILPVIFQKILGTIKNPNSERAKAIKPFLVSFGKSLAEKFPGEICPTSTDES